MMAATRKLDQSELMIRAGAQGESAVQRAQESRTRNRQQTLSRKESARQFDRATDQEELDRWQRQWEVQRRQRGLADAERSANQAAKADTTIFGGKGRRERELAEQDARERVSDREKFEETKRQFDESQGLEAAKAGLKAKGEGGGFPAPTDRPYAGAETPTPRDIQQVPSSEEEGLIFRTTPGGPDRTGAQASLDPRMAQLQQDMDQRGQEQMGQPLELGTQGSGWIADPSTPAARTAMIKQQSAELALIKRRRDLGFQMQTAQARLDASNTKENKELLKESEIKAQARLANFSGRYDRFDNAMGLTGDKPTAADWAAIRKLVAESKVPEVGNAEGIHEAVRGDGKVNQRLIEWLGEKRAMMAVQYVANGTGELPDREYVDFLTDGMREFMDQVQAARLKTKFDFGGPVGLMSATTRARQRRIVQKMAAMTMLGGKTMAVGPEGTAGNTEQVMAGASQPGAAPGGAAGGAVASQEVGATGGQPHGAAPGGMKRQQLAGRQHEPGQMGQQVANLGEPRKWSEVQ